MGNRFFLHIFQHLQITFKIITIEASATKRHKSSHIYFQFAKKVLLEL